MPGGLGVDTPEDVRRRARRRIRIGLVLLAVFALAFALFISAVTASGSEASCPPGKSCSPSGGASLVLVTSLVAALASLIGALATLLTALATLRKLRDGG